MIWIARERRILAGLSAWRIDVNTTFDGCAILIERWQFDC